MPQQGTNRWRRVIAGCGALTSLVALAAIGREGQPALVSLWLLFAGLALAALSLHAMRKERAALEALDESEAERERAVQGRRAAEERSHELAETSPDIVTLHGRDGTHHRVSSACRDVLGYEPDELIGRHLRRARARRGPPGPARDAQPRPRGRRRQRHLPARPP